MDSDSGTLPNLWRVFNLRESPYFQETLGSSRHSYPLSLFVGRAAETRQLLTIIGSTRSSRQPIGGPPGIGKTTLVQSVKAGTIAAGYWAADELVPFYETDTTEHVLGRILSALYDTILAARPMVAEHAAMQAAQQLVKVARLTSGGGSISILGVGGGVTKGTTTITPSGAMLFDGPRIMRDLLTLVREAEAAGIVLHLDNLENLTEKTTDRAADILRSLRDPVLLLDGLHLLLVGTTAAVLSATGTHAQVRSVFTTPLTLEPLPMADVQALLAARYSMLALNGRDPIPPIDAGAVAALYPLFRGDLRSLLTALEEGARLLTGVSAPGTSISFEELRPALQQRYSALVRERLDGRRLAQLAAWASRGPASEQTQKALKDLWNVSQGAVSTALAELERQGYVLALPREGKNPIRYVLTGVSRLIFG
ncbi:MAG TPA: ATP-binding protein [Gemmatimonadaceae bacterium]|nr:ATP-binding protein [Gemmatimonadaceae bacterium]